MWQNGDIPTKGYSQCKRPCRFAALRRVGDFRLPVRRFDETELPVGKAFFKEKHGFEKTLHAEGKRTRTLYLAPEGRSSLSDAKLH